MRINNKITKINILILVISFLAINVYSRTNYSRPDMVYGLLVFLAMAISIQVFINLVLFLFKIFSKDPEKKEDGKIFLLNALLILLIGFPSCLLNMTF